MKDSRQTKAQLIDELVALRRRVSELERRCTGEVSPPPAGSGRAEEALRESEAKYRQLFETVSDAVIVFDARTRQFVDVNDAALQLYGYTKDEFLGMRNWDVTAEPEKSDVDIGQVLTGELTRIPVRYHKKKDGTVFPTEISASALTIGGRHVLCAAIRDITDQRRASESLRKSEQRYRAIVEDQTELICRWLPGGNHTFVNGAYCRCFGKSEEELIGRSLMDLIPPADHERALRHFNALCRENPVATHEHRVIAPSGEIRWHQWTDRAFFDAQGNIVEYQSVGRDITDHKLAEEALRQSEEKWRSLVSTAPDHILMIDPDGTIQYLNRSVPGQRTEDVVGTSVFDHVPQEDHQKMRTCFDQVLRSGEFAGYETQVTSPAGETSWYATRVGPFRRDGQIVGLTLIATDITERRRSEQARQDSEERFRLATRATRDAIYDWDIVADRSWRNKRYRELFQPADTTSYDWWHANLHPQDRDRVVASLEQTFQEGGDYWNGEYRFRRADGEYAEVIDRGFILRDEDGTPLRMIGAMTDDTERKQADRKLKESEERLRLAVQNVPVMLDAFDENGNIIVWNRECERITGYSADEIVGNPRAIELLYPDPEYRERMMAEWAARPDDYRDWEWEAACKDGTRRILAWSNQSERYPIPGWASWGVGVNVTARKRAEEALRRSRDELEEKVKERTAELSRANAELEERIAERQRAHERLSLLSLAVEQSTEGIGVSDLEGNLLFVNQAFAAMHGFVPEELVSQNLKMFHTPEQLPSVEEANRRMLEAGEFSGEIWHLRRDETTFPALMHNSLLRDDSGAPVGMIGAMRDITERKQAERALRHSEHLLRQVIDASPNCIFLKDRDGRFLLVNRRMALSHGTTPEDMVGRTDWDFVGSSIAAPEDVERYLADDRAVIETRQLRRIPDESFTLPDGTVRWHQTVKVPLSLGDDPDCVLGVAIDITERKMAEQALRHRIEFEALITAISTRFINLPTDVVDREIDRSLRQIGEFAGVDRSYVFQFTEGADCMSNTHEWCAPGVQSAIDRLQDLPFARLPWFSERIKRPELIHVPRVADLPPEAEAEKKEWRAEAIQSLVCVPMMCAGTPTGFVGFDSVRSEKTWPDEIVALLRIFGETLANTIERKRAEGALRESQRTLSTLMGNLPGMVYRCRNDQDWTMEFVSEGCHDLTGYQPADLIENRRIAYGQVIVSEDRDAVWEGVQASVQSRRAYRLVYRIKTASGEVRWVWEQGQGIFSTTGELLALEGFITDITERKQAEKALQESEERFRRLAEAAQEGIIIHEGGKVLDASNTFARMFGYEPAEVIGLDGFEFIAPDSRRIVRRNVREGYEGRYDAIGVRKNGTTFPIEIRARSMPYHGRTVRVAAMRDLTERVQAEEALRRADRVAALGTVVAGVAHELNNPLTSICGLAGLLVRDQSLRENTRDIAEEIAGQGLRCSRIVEDLLGFARARPVELQPVQVNDILRRCLDLSRKGRRFDDIEIIERFDPALPTILADPYRLEQVFLNIIGNASDALHQRQTARQLAVETVHSAGQIQVTFTDNGPGITEPSRIFDPFYSTKPIGEGTGLGLSVSHGIIAEHGGSITAENLSVGARFAVRLPVRTAPTDPKSTKRSGRANDAPGGGGTGV